LKDLIPIFEVAIPTY